MEVEGKITHNVFKNISTVQKTEEWKTLSVGTQLNQKLLTASSS